MLFDIYYTSAGENPFIILAMRQVSGSYLIRVGKLRLGVIKGFSILLPLPRNALSRS